MQILGISGSLRKGSFNTLLLEAVGKLVEAEGSSFSIATIDGIPLYNSDLDGDDKPASVASLIAAIGEADGVIIATPEYNYSVPGVLKNAIDWASRPAYKSEFAHKPTGILSASMSPVGGARSQVHLRDILAGMLTPVYPTPDYLLGTAQNAFNDNGQLNDEQSQKRLKRYVEGYLSWVKGLSGTIADS